MPSPKHVVIITADQMRPDAMGPAGNAAAITPHLDRLAERGCVFDRAYCVAPTCTPSRTAIFTGRYPNVTGTWQVGTELGDDEPTLCDRLAPAGFRRVAVGKMHFRPQREGPFPEIGPPAPAEVRDRPRATDGTFFGFDEHHITEDSRTGEYLDWLADVAPRCVRRKDVDPDARACVRDGSNLPAQFHQTRWVGEWSERVVREHDPSQPLFLWTSFVDPHHPFDAPGEYVQRYAGRDLPGPVRREGEHALRPAHLRRNDASPAYPWPGAATEHGLSDEEIAEIVRNYYAMVTFLDEEVGRLLDVLETRGMLDETLIVFSTDHGELLGDHGLLMKGPWMYESLTRVPMIVAGPGLARGMHTEALMENVDVAPTILDALGMDLPVGMQGRSQLPVLRGEAARVRDSAMCAYDAHDVGYKCRTLHTDRYKLTLFAGETYGELFDLAEDPHELHNRFFDEAYASIRAEMTGRFARRMMEDEDPLPVRRAQW